MIIEQKHRIAEPVKKKAALLCSTYDLLNGIRKSIGRGGRDRKSEKYIRVTRSEVQLYIQLFVPRQQKPRGIKQRVAMKPIISSELNSCCQVDLTDFQPRVDGEYR